MADVKMLLLTVASVLLPQAALAQVIPNTCPGRTLADIPAYNIPAGTLMAGLKPGGGDTDGNPTSYEYTDQNGHHLFLPANKIQLINCSIVKHQRGSAFDAGYSLHPLASGKE
ncbi:hypothetical protein [Gluconobacter sp. Dm-44]|uniref:hypothetical protein n=1 Tax=Gluconobacter sp. Dm-44 TaxID=2799805 RepID=UPI001B8C9F8E|nr:hypothetical protein [Gluconobacter sp. Dm-44]MBS1061148.1 hypothetical protein [Gluconobacter sp. Dm-44]